MHRTFCPVRTGTTTVMMDALASYRVAGFVFLIHEATEHNGYMPTYAPTGLRAGGPYTTVQDALDALDRCAHNLSTAITNEFARMAVSHMPLLAPETGIQVPCDWHYRESQRFHQNEYLPVPSVNGLVYPHDHYLHLSVTKTESDFVAYTPNSTYGEADRQVRLKFGKYLRKAFPSLSDAEVQSAVVSLRAKLALASAPAQLLFATDQDTIDTIFETEMYACDSSYKSCMHGKFTAWDHRPYHVYADSPDVAVAYVLEHGSIVSRSVISTKDKTWVRPYSIQANDSTYCQALIQLLEAAGYESGSLEGNRLTKLPNRNGAVVLPYIDHGGMQVTSSGKYWEVCESDGEYIGDHTDGLASGNTPQCERCNHDDEEDCQCSTCECCEEPYYETPDCSCSFCEDCDGCREHNGCECARCERCDNIISPRRRYTTACECSRCSDCGELERDCECEHCPDCNELDTNCTCPNDESQNETQEATA